MNHTNDIYSRNIQTTTIDVHHVEKCFYIIAFIHVYFIYLFIFYDNTVVSIVQHSAVWIMKFFCND